ncbi:MAG TPA: hydrogenase small subunit [Acidobacteriota bacterium]|nr:hydrogenase small subunit [Acidobacteriota bacterium]
MDKEPLSIWQAAQARGYSRRDFLKFCGVISAALGLEASQARALVQAMDTKPRPPILWYHFQECTCCSESFIKSTHPIVADVLLDRISLDYSQTLQAAAGEQAEAAAAETIKKYPGQYILAAEGSIPMKDGGVYCTIGGKTALAALREAAEHAMAVVSWGSCASNGCVQAASPNPTGATPIHKILPGVVNVPGCPPIAEVMTGVIVHLLAFGRLPELDSQGRPKAFYSTRIHDSCYRRPYFDAGLFVESFDDAGAKKGYCLYKMGCRGPQTYNSCGILRWNGSTSYPIQSGAPCIGCSEAGYYDAGPFTTSLPSFPGFGVETTADRLGIYLAAASGGAVALHAIATNIRKRRLIKKELEGSLKDKDIKAAKPADKTEGGA